MKKTYFTEEEKKEAIRINKQKYREKNKEKLSKLRKEYYEKNKEKEKDLAQKYRYENKEKVKETSKNYSKNNRSKINEYHKNRLKNDPVYKVKYNFKMALLKAFKRNGFSKNSNSVNILGCSYEELKNHIESLWEPWMSWDNHGLYNGEEGYGWDIDHVKPLSTAKTEEDIIRLNHYSNLQPLCSKINRDIKRG